MKHKESKGHPHHKGPGMSYFHKEHWQKDLADVDMQDSRYASEMNAAEEYKSRVDGLANYVKKHKMKH